MNFCVVAIKHNCHDVRQVTERIIKSLLFVLYSGLTVDNIMNFCVVAFKHNCHDVRQVAERIINAYYLFFTVV